MNNSKEDKKAKLLFSYGNDGDNDEFAWDDFIENIRYSIMKKVTKFFVTGSNMGWRHLSGHTIVETDKAREFMDKIMPDTGDLSIEVYKSDEKGAICEMTIYHHDAPTGEYRTVYAYSTAKKLKLIPKGE